MVIVDDFSRVILLLENSEAFEQARVLFKKIHNEKGYFIKRIRTDHGKKYENESFAYFFEKNDIMQDFSAPITQPSRGFERKNRVIQEMAWSMMHCQNISKYFWGEVVNTTSHIINRVCLRLGANKTPNEWWKGKSPQPSTSMSSEVSVTY
jgi:transposase InsO family protein